MVIEIKISLEETVYVHFIGNNSILSQHLSHSMFIRLSVSLFLKSVSKLDLELEVDMGLLKYLLCIFIFSIILQNMTLKRILGIGPNTGK